MTDKELIIMQWQIDTLKTITLWLLLNIHSSKLWYPNFKLPEFIINILAKYIAWRAKRDFRAVQARIQWMELVIKNAKN